MTQAVIIAGGKGTRLLPHTKKIPKSLIEIQGKPLLYYLLHNLRKQGCLAMVFCLGYLGDRIQNYVEDLGMEDCTFSFCYEEKPLGTGGALGNVSHVLLEKHFFLIYGDIFFNMDLQKIMAFHLKKRAMATLVLHPSSHPYDSDIVEMDEKKRVTAFRRVKPGEKFTNLSNAALYVLSKDIIRYIDKNEKQDFVKHVFPRIMKKGKAIYGYSTNEYVKDMGTFDRLKTVEKDISEVLYGEQC